MCSLTGECVKLSAVRVYGPLASVSYCCPMGTLLRTFATVTIGWEQIGNITRCRRRRVSSNRGAVRLVALSHFCSNTFLTHVQDEAEVTDWRIPVRFGIGRPGSWPL